MDIVGNIKNNENYNTEEIAGITLGIFEDKEQNNLYNFVYNLIRLEKNVLAIIDEVIENIKDLSEIQNLPEIQQIKAISELSSVIKDANITQVNYWNSLLSNPQENDDFINIYNENSDIRLINEIIENINKRTKIIIEEINRRFKELLKVDNNESILEIMNKIHEFSIKQEYEIKLQALICTQYLPKDQQVETFKKVVNEFTFSEKNIEDITSSIKNLHQDNQIEAVKYFFYKANDLANVIMMIDKISRHNLFSNISVFDDMIKSNFNIKEKLQIVHKAMSCINNMTNEKMENIFIEAINIINYDGALTKDEKIVELTNIFFELPTKFQNQFLNNLKPNIPEYEYYYIVNSMVNKVKGFALDSKTIDVIFNSIKYLSEEKQNSCIMDFLKNILTKNEEKLQRVIVKFMKYEVSKLEEVYLSGEQIPNDLIIIVPYIISEINLLNDQEKFNTFYEIINELKNCSSNNMQQKIMELMVENLKFLSDDKKTEAITMFSLLTRDLNEGIRSQVLSKISERAKILFEKQPDISNSMVKIIDKIKFSLKDKIEFEFEEEIEEEVENKDEYKDKEIFAFIIEKFRDLPGNSNILAILQIFDKAELFKNLSNEDKTNMFKIIFSPIKNDIKEYWFKNVNEVVGEIIKFSKDIQTQIIESIFYNIENLTKNEQAEAIETIFPSYQDNNSQIGCKIKEKINELNDKIILNNKLIFSKKMFMQLKI